MQPRLSESYGQLRGLRFDCNLRNPTNASGSSEPLRIPSIMRLKIPSSMFERVGFVVGFPSGSVRIARWIGSLSMSLLLTSATTVLAQSPSAVCDACNKPTHSQHHSTTCTDSGVQIPSLQTLFIDKLNRAGDRLETKIHRHPSRAVHALRKACDKPDCAHCSAAGRESYSANAANRGSTPFQNDNATATGKRLPEITPSLRNTFPQILTPTARGKLSDAQPRSSENLIDARKLVPYMAPPSPMTSPAIQSKSSPHVADTEVAEITEETQEFATAADAPELLDIARKVEPETTSVPVGIDRPEASGTNEDLGKDRNDTLESTEDLTLESIGNRSNTTSTSEHFIPSNPTARPHATNPAATTSAIPAFLESREPSSIPGTSREIPSRTPTNSDAVPSNESLPDILVDPFQEDVRTNAPSELGRAERPNGVQPKPFPSNQSFSKRNSVPTTGTLKAKFETAKRLNSNSRIGSPAIDTEALPPSTPRR